MTSDLKPYAYAIFNPDGNPDSDHLTTCSLTRDDIKNGYTEMPLYTSPVAVPDVPELVRYDQSDICLAIENGYDPLPSDEGEYVLYEQAAAMIAAKDKEVQELKEKLGVVSTERHADAEYIGHLQAELAQIKAQKPVAVVRFDRSDGNENEMPRVVSCNWLPDGNYTLYAAPIDQKKTIIAELEAILHDWLNTPKFIRGYATKPIAALIQKYRALQERSQNEN